MQFSYPDSTVEQEVWYKYKYENKYHLSYPPSD